MEQVQISRRSVLGGMSGLLGMAAFSGEAWSAFAQGATTPAALKATPRLQPFRMQQVRLLDSLFKQQAEINDRYLDSLNTDRLLHSFRLTSGLSSSAVPYGGWEKPDCELRGHFTGGHYLSAVALSSAGSRNDALKKRGNALVSELAKCQRANRNGYLSAFPEGGFGKLAAGGNYWAPFYTYHKIMAGLLDMYAHTGNEEALQVAEGMANWVSYCFRDVSDDRRMFMLRTEYGGMNEALANLYALTGKEKYLAYARIFEQPMFLDPLAGHRDELKGLHANTHVPKVIGAARMYEITGQTRYRDIAMYFLDEVLAERNYAIGNCSTDEHWKSTAGDLRETLSYFNAECCVAYNLMKLERQVFSWTGNAVYMDAYERALWNSRMGTQNAEGLKQYFFPLASGYWRRYNSAENSFWCCTGTGAEEFAKFNDTIYFHDGESVWINQFISSELEWPEQRFGLRQKTNFPLQQGTSFKLKLAQPQQRTLYLRIPAWTCAGGSVAINGRKLEAFATPGSYLALSRVWHDSDTIDLSLPMQLRYEPLPGDPGTRAALYGPLVLAAVMGEGPKDGTLKIGGYEPGPEKNLLPPPAANPVMPADGLEIMPGQELRFRSDAQGVRQVKPLYQITEEKYGVYWQQTEV